MSRVCTLWQVFLTPRVHTCDYAMHTATHTTLWQVFLKPGVHTFDHALCRMFTCARICALCLLALGSWIGGFSGSLCMALVAGVGGCCRRGTRKRYGVCLVCFSIFCRGVGVYVCVCVCVCVTLCVYICTLTHTLHGVLYVSLGVGIEQPGEPGRIQTDWSTLYM